LTNYVRGGEGRPAVWQIVKCRALAVNVGWIYSPLVAARCGGVAGQGMNRLPEPTAATYRMHKYNWSVTTACCTLYHTRSKLGSVRPADRCLHGSLTKAARSLSVRVMLKNTGNADTGHYMVAAPFDTATAADQRAPPMRTLAHALTAAAMCVVMQALHNYHRQ